MAADIHLAHHILDALAAMPRVRKGLTVKPRYDDPVWLEIGAFEGNKDGGSGHGDMLIPISLGSKILDAVEQFLNEELKRLNVTR